MIAISFADTLPCKWAGSNIPVLLSGMSEVFSLLVAANECLDGFNLQLE